MRHDSILVDAVRLAHGRLDVQALDVLPVLLQQGHQEVHGVHDVTCVCVYVYACEVGDVWHVTVDNVVA